MQVGEPAQWLIGVHAGQVSGLPWSSHRPAAQIMHCESMAELQVSGDVHCATGLQG